MPLIRLGPRRLDEYAAAIGPAAVTALRQRARPLAGLRILHLSAGPFGGAVAESLASLVPLQRDLGLVADWHVLRGDAPRVWTALYEGLSGFNVHWGEKERQAWYVAAERHAANLPLDYDLVVAHDPQAVALAELLARRGCRARWIWHCHLDTREAGPEVWADLRRALDGYVAVLYPSPALTRPDLPVEHVAIGRPAIDPRAPRNLPVGPAERAERLGRLGIDPDRRIVGQFGPIDHRYAPIAALGAYWMARRESPGLQIVLAETAATVTERARHTLEQVADAAGTDPDVHILTAQAGLSPADLGALQQSVAVVLQLAVPRGFGWGLAECQWQGKPAVVGRHGQLPEQVEEGRSGIVVSGAPDAATALGRLLADPALSAVMGRRGYERVGRDYLVTGLLDDYLELFRAIERTARAG